MISVIIPTFNKSSRLKVCLHYLLQQKHEIDFEVIVINDGSTDDTAEILDDFKDAIKVITTSNRGRSSARNIGVENASYELLLFLDDDIIVNNKTLIDHVEAHAVTGVYVVHGKIVHLPYMKAFNNPCVTPRCKSKKLIDLYKKITLDIKMDVKDVYRMLSKYSMISKFEKLIKDAVNDNNYYRWLCFLGANTSIKKAVLYKAGKFDENFSKNWGCEDIELGYRINNIPGVNFIYKDNSCVFHMDHFKGNYLDEHIINMGYFVNKYCDKRLEALSLYFNDSITEKELFKIGEGFC